ncbi:MerR family transcriptional regulator [Vibrio sp. T187]|uniref:MerR family transcriptional regulator n=1 Tax=Vibrio TaxID=662 RepID=UPI0010CA0638|nr:MULTISPECIES: MerR family transcriptional regulator [Vibrio]MBW3696036.1 MerR family transcriptional regulator [Vibrio sp. T187]
MNMRSFAERVGLSPHTLRYYEKIGLLSNVQRNTSGHRDYSQKDIDWITFVKRLKETGMPLSEIQGYAQLRALGADTAQQRQQLLERHKKSLQAHIELQQSHLAALETKINLYKDNKVT